MKYFLILTALLLAPLAALHAAQPGDPFVPYLDGNAPEIVRETPSATAPPENITVRCVVFRSRDDSEIFAVIARPKTPGKHPGMLVLHGGGGSAEIEKAMAWAQRGYVAVAPDLPGIAEPKKLTLTKGKFTSLKYGAGRWVANPDASASVIFDAVLAAMKALYLLRSQPDVDTSRIGVVGCSWGGYMTTMVCGLAGDQVRAGFAVWGCGYYELTAQLNGPKSTLGGMPADERERWLRHLDAGRRAPDIKAAFFIAGATNDFFYWPRAVQATLDAVPGEKNHFYAPNANHKAPVPGGSVFASKPVAPFTPTPFQPYPTPNGSKANWLAMEVPFFDYYLKGVGQPLPKVSVEKAGDPLLARFSVIAPRGLTKVEVYWAKSNPDVMKRQWLALPATKTGDHLYEAHLPAEAADWFALVSDDRPVTVSSDLVQVVAPARSLLRPSARVKPNIVFLLADDLGYGDLGCYGQQKIRTPNIDRLAREGMRFTAHYAGSNVCAPSRCALMTGKHTGHTYIRDNEQAKAIGLPFAEGQVPVPPDCLELPLGLKRLGYTSGGFGKWGLGPVGSTGDPLKQGFDRFFGYNCQAVAHNYYPQHLWDDSKQITLSNPIFAAHQKLPAGADLNAPETYARFSGRDYAPDIISAEARKFLRANKERPFFLYYATTVPHLALQVPADSLAEYAGKFPEEPYPGGNGYLPHRTPRAAYAAMITRMDREVGRIVDLVKEEGLENRTIFVFTSDNGPLYDKLGGTDAEFFNSAGGFRGRKGAFYEGGFREPCIVRWKGRVAAGVASDRVTGFEDWLPTLFELIGQKEATPARLDGISFAPTLLGQSQPPRVFLYRESPGYGGQQSVRVGDWKALRKGLLPAGRPHAGKAKTASPGPIELYDLATDPGESRDVAAEHPDVVARLGGVMKREHEKSEVWPIPALDRQQP